MIGKAASPSGGASVGAEREAPLTEPAELWVLDCDRPGHPKNYAHAHPHITDMCSTDQHRTCQLLARYVSCDCGCHRD